MTALLVLLLVAVVVGLGVIAFGNYGYGGGRPVVRRRVIVERRAPVVRERVVRDPVAADEYDEVPVRRRRRYVEEDL